MTAGEPLQRVRIYLSERDSADGQPLYLVALDRLRREGASGATVLRGIAGFGSGHRLRTAGIADFSQQTPVVIEWLDRAERVARVLPTLDEMLGDALITIEDIKAYRAALRSSGPFGSRSVADAARDEIAIIPPDMLLAEAVERLARSRQPLLAVVEGQRLAGVLMSGDAERFGAIALDALAELDDAERAAVLARVAVRPVRDVMREPRAIYIESPLAHTVNLLVEWGLDALPVTDGDGRLVGIFGIEQALRAALDGVQPSQHVRNSEPPPVSLIMQMLVPTAAGSADAATVLLQALQTPIQAVVLVNGFYPTGVVSIPDATRRVRNPLRSAWIAALAGDRAPLAALASTSGVTAMELASTPDLISSRASEYDAIRMLIENRRQHLVVVDSEGRLAGMVTRRGVLRALAQEGNG
jgi:PII-like signaling protein/predicted transcriptional regulator